MDDAVIQAAQEAFSLRLTGSSDVSENTRNAQAIAKKWRSAVHRIDPDRYRIEESIDGELDQKIDIVDSEQMWAYEFKVSGKNAWAEFYKDVVKVIVWNQKRKRKIARLVFITDVKHGKRFLDSPMPREYIRYLEQIGLAVQVEYVRQS